MDYVCHKSRYFVYLLTDQDRLHTLDGLFLSNGYQKLKRRHFYRKPSQKYPVDSLL